MSDTTNNKTGAMMYGSLPSSANYEREIIIELRKEVERLGHFLRASQSVALENQSEVFRLRAENERLRGEVEHWSGPVQQSWKKAWTEAQTIYDKSIKELETENEKLLGVLKYIAKQELFEEMDEETREHANFEDAYEWLVQEARRALLDKING